MGASALAALLLTAFTPTVASAADGTAQFAMSATSARPGQSVILTQGDACPARPADAYDQMLEMTFTDADGVVMSGSVQTDADGNWDTEGRARLILNNHRLSSTGPGNPPPAFVQPPAAQGAGIMDARCVLYTDGATTVVQEYASQALTVSGDPVQFTMAATSGQTGGTVRVESVEPCRSNRVQGSFSSTDAYASHFDMALSGDGAWSIDLPLSSENMDGTRTPLVPGLYGLHVYCFDDATVVYNLMYADKLFTVTGSTPPPPVYDCKDLALFAVTGSGEHFNGATNLSVSPTLKTVRDGFMSVLTAGKKAKLRVINYPARPVTTLTQEYNPAKYLEGKNVGVTRLLNAIDEYRTNCAGKPIAIITYSQGALVAREAMVKYAATHTGAARQAITTIVEIASPARLSDSPVVDFGTADKMSHGLCKYLAGGGCFKDTPFTVKEMPPVYQGRTWAVCKQHDVVCDTSTVAAMMWPVPPYLFPEAQLVHTSYYGDQEVKLAGKRAARQVNNKF